MKTLMEKLQKLRMRVDEMAHEIKKTEDSLQCIGGISCDENSYPDPKSPYRFYRIGYQRCEGKMRIVARKSDTDWKPWAECDLELKIRTFKGIPFLLKSMEYTADQLLEELP